MAKKPDKFWWLEYSKEQNYLLEQIDFYGNNGWDSNGQADTLMPILMGKCRDAGLTVRQIRDAMELIGYDHRTTHQLQRWENKRTTGKFGR